MSFIKKLFLSILTAFPTLTNHAFLHDVCNVKLQLYAKGLVWSHGGKQFSKTFSISYMLNSRNRVFNPYFLICTCPMRKSFLQIILGVNILFFHEKVSFSLKLFFDLLRQFVIMTVRSPLPIMIVNKVTIFLTISSLKFAKNEHCINNCSYWANTFSTMIKPSCSDF